MTETAYKTQVFDKNNEQLFVETKADYVLGLNEKIENAVPLKKIKVNGQEIAIDANKAVDITIAAAPEYTIEKAASADSGYSATYQLKKGNNLIGEKINIPKDLVVESGTVETCTTANNPVQGYKKGDKYIDLVLANSNNQHIYILVTDLIDVYTSGNGITVTGQEIAIDTIIVATQTDLAGKQDKIDATHKLDADLLSEGTTNKLVSAEEKTAWNNKQNAISDLETIRTGAGKGATAVQPADLDNFLRFVKVEVTE